MRPVDNQIKEQLTRQLEEIGDQLDADVVAIFSPILPGLELSLRSAIEALSERKDSVAIILDTPGGVAEVVERMVTAIRFNYEEVIVIVPNTAMSAGTILALSADRIMMDHFSCLGPIDPQIEKDGKLVPALSYLDQFERLNQKAQTGQLTTAEYALLNKLDLGELYQFEQARELSIDLLIKWLTQYKFRTWQKTETQGIPVDEDMKMERARQIAALLNDPTRWRSHGRAIDMDTLRGEEIKLKIENFQDDPSLYKKVREYFGLLKDYMNREQHLSFVHSKEYF
ncbi:MAG: serine dehydrogenasease [Gammaproteobacteria bacterium]|nr:serine dehydrogenasease [Gammaproteobacteria bacterium]MYH46273.1 serine dehydrogenasease [Gammaproteobacteria bacterium]MYL13888.1 serine dehydrogenasease [Gammaproteobacteria bacterium]